MSNANFQTIIPAMGQNLQVILPPELKSALYLVCIWVINMAVLQKFGFGATLQARRWLLDQRLGISFHLAYLFVDCRLSILTQFSIK